MNPKGKQDKAIKLFDTKDFKGAIKACEKILDKNPKNEEALALKGLSQYYLGEKAQAKKTINDAIKLNIKSAVPWHYYGIYNKEELNYFQAVKCYSQAIKNDPTNYNVLRDLCYLKLYLREIDSFTESAKKALELKPNMYINWITYAFGCCLKGDYSMSSYLIESTIKNGVNVLKNNEKHELKIFNSFLLDKMGKYADAMNYLLDNKNDLIDQTLFNEKVVEYAIKCNNLEIAKKHLENLFEINSENIEYFLNYFNITINNFNEFKLKNYEDLINLEEDNKYIPKLYEILVQLNEKYPKSLLINRLKLAISRGDQFKEIFKTYFLNQLRITIPSFFINIKFLYKYQKYKIPIISEIMNYYLNELKTKNIITEELYCPTNFSWLYYFASQHYDTLLDLEQALFYINKAIDLTPSVLEFFTEKSKILKRGYMLESSMLAYKKAKNLDVGDRYLNARYSKCLLRLGNVEKSNKVMSRFFSNPLSEENVDYYQCLWYEEEASIAFIKNNKLLHSHCLLKAMLHHFPSMVDDQSDFYNFCLRKYMINDLYKIIIYLDKITDMNFAFDTIEKIDLIYNYITSFDNDESKKLEKQLNKEYEEMKSENYVKYKYTDLNSLANDIINDVYNILKKLQPICNNPKIHFYCVKYFLIKNKIIFALKSLKFLNKEKNDSFYFIYSLNLFKKYCEKNSNNFSEAYSDIIKEFLNQNAKVDCNKWVEDNKIENSLFVLYNKGKYNNTKENSKEIDDIFKCGEQSYFRSICSKNINRLVYWVSLYIDNNKKDLEEFNTKLKSIMEIKNIKEEDIIGNLSFYCDKMPEKKNN